MEGCSSGEESGGETGMALNCLPAGQFSYTVAPVSFCKDPGVQGVQDA